MTNVNNNKNITIECTFSSPIKVSNGSELDYLYENGGFFSWIGNNSDVIKAMLVDLRNAKVSAHGKVTDIYVKGSTITGINVKVQFDVSAFNNVDGFNDFDSITDFKEYILETFSDDIKKIAIDRYLVYSLDIEDMERTPLKLI